MAQQPEQAPAEKRFDDHSVIVPPHRLKNVIKHTREDGHIDMTVVKRAEDALAELKGEFGVWMNAECDRLEGARRMIHANGINRITLDALFLPAHDIKGGASTLGFPLAERIATSLCRLITHAPDTIRIQRKMIDHHVDAIRAVVREDVQDPLNPYGMEIAERLSIMVETFLAEEMKDAYAEIAGDAAPRMMIPEKN